MELERITDWLKKSEDELAHIRYQLEDIPKVKMYSFQTDQDECVLADDFASIAFTENVDSSGNLVRNTAMKGLIPMPCDENPRNDCLGTFSYPLALQVAKENNWRLIEKTYYMCSVGSEDYTE